MGAARFRGDEFHYSEVALDPSSKFAYKLSRGIGIREMLDGAVIKNTLGSYTHLPAPGKLVDVPELCRWLPEPVISGSLGARTGCCFLFVFLL